MFAQYMKSKRCISLCFERADRALKLWLYVAFVPNMTKPRAFVLVNFVTLVTSELLTVSCNKKIL